MSAPLPPGPPLPSWAQAALSGIRPPWYFRASQRRYGNIIRMRMPLAGNYVYLADPGDVRAVFRGDPAVYHAGEANGSILEPILGPTSVLVTDEGAHQRQRRLMSPPFHGSSVRKQTDVMAQIASDEIERWPVGTAFPVLPRMRRLTLEVILRTVIGAEKDDRLDHLREVLPPVVDISGIDLMAVGMPRLRGHWPWTRLQARRARADQALYDEIASCRADQNLEERTDVLAMLVRATDEDGSSMSDAELRDQIMTLLLAGHETTATGLAWTFERLTRHPEVLDRAQRAALDDDDGYLDSVVTESLRVRPVIADVARRLTEEVELGGYLIPAGSVVAPAIMLIQADERVYPNAAAFDPERWVGQHTDPFTWLPFGGGNRRCLGAAFATTEMRVVLKEVLRRVEFATTAARGERTRIRHVTFVPAKGGVVTVNRRRKFSPHGYETTLEPAAPAAPARPAGPAGPAA
ncbi:MAG TPA: cytochrome P450 [Acidimicrobiales bacterium]|nr:cytochrome P450 [Acidimicrobiales bacterium]